MYFIIHHPVHNPHCLQPPMRPEAVLPCLVTAHHRGARARLEPLLDFSERFTQGRIIVPADALSVHPGRPLSLISPSLNKSFQLVSPISIAMYKTPSFAQSLTAGFAWV